MRPSMSEYWRLVWHLNLGYPPSHGIRCCSPFNKQHRSENMAKGYQKLSIEECHGITSLADDECLSAHNRALQSMQSTLRFTDKRTYIQLLGASESFRAWQFEACQSSAQVSCPIDHTTDVETEIVSRRLLYKLPEGSQLQVCQAETQVGTLCRMWFTSACFTVNREKSLK